MESATTIECTLSLSGRGVDAEAVTRALGLAPTRVWRQRHAALAGRTDLANVAWQHTVASESWTSLDDAVSALLAAMGPARERVAACAEALGLKVAVVCVVKIYDERPAYFVGPERLRALVEMGAEWALEVYDRRGLD